MATATRRPWTAEELARLPEGWRYEIDEGELIIMAPAGVDHGDHTANVTALLRTFARRRQLGKVLTGEVGFRLRTGRSQTLRAADVAFVSNERLARIADRRGFSDVPPDLAVEIHDLSEPDLQRKIGQYLTAGVRSVWVIDPERRTLTRYGHGQAPRIWDQADAIVDEPVLPGFSATLGEILGEA